MTAVDSTLAFSRAALADDGPSSEARWAIAARGGDRRAFEELVRLHQARVFRLVGRFYRRPEDVEDAAQETFLTAWSKLHTYAAKAPFEHWLTRVCLNVCYQRLRSEKPAEALGERDPGAPPPDPDAPVDAERLLARLDPRDRFVLRMLHGEGWTTAEIADRLGWSRANVKVRAYRARRRLRRLVEGSS